MLYPANLFFETFSEAALAFARAADNGPGSLTGRLVTRLKKYLVHNPDELEEVINQIQTADVSVYDHKKKWAKHKPHLFKIERVDGVLVFKWDCEPPPAKRKVQGETTKITLRDRHMLITSSRRASMLRRKDAALGLRAKFPWQDVDEEDPEPTLIGVGH